MTNGQLPFAVIHAALALLAPFLLFALVGCEDDQGKKVDYGPEITSQALFDALQDAIRDSYPENTKVGAFIKFETTDLIAGGQSRFLTTMTGQTVVARHESETEINLSIVEKKASVKPDGTTELIKRQEELPFKKPAPAPAATPAHLVETARMMSDGSWIRAFAAAGPLGNARAAEESVRVTLHRLRAWDTTEPAPAAVAARPSCLGLPNCQLTYRHVAFDIVIWDRAEGDPMKIEMIMSPQIPQTAGFKMFAAMGSFFPYVPGMIKSCITRLVEVDDNGARTLVSECQEVTDFQFEHATP